MKLSLKTFLPATIVSLIGVILIGAFYLRIPVMHLAFAQGLHLKGTEMLDNVSPLLGDGAIALGAASFAWFIFKKNLKASTKFIKMLGVKVFNLHAFFGWTALILVALHGGYFLITDFSNRNNLTGIAAFLVLACIGAYGFLIKRYKNKSIKKVHFLLTTAWLVTLLIHGGGFVIAACGGLLGLFILLSLLKSGQKEKAAKSSRTSPSFK